MSKTSTNNWETIEFTVLWQEFSGEGELESHKGWYVEIKPFGYSIGPDFCGDGLASFDEALIVIDNWCKGRGYKRAKDHECLAASLFIVKAVKS